MNLNLIEELLNEDESTSLDFKREQYPFEGATDEQKSELLKDILAFANSWKRTDAYILIGVDDVKGARKKVVGIIEHLDDARLQQFVNSKTQRPIIFSYKSMTFEGKQIGVIKIERQDRPLFLKKDYGKLKKHEVYIRHGSSTAIANPDDIAKMGIGVISSVEVPELNLEFANPAGEGFGKSIEVALYLVEYDESKISGLDSLISHSVLNNNFNYKRQLAKYIKETSLFSPVYFRLTNKGSVLATNARLLLSIGKDLPVRIVDEYDYPEKPSINNVYASGFSPMYAQNHYSLEEDNSKWILNVNFGNIQPKATVRSGGGLYIGATTACEVDLNGFLFGDNMPNPIKVPLKINISLKRRQLQLEELQ